MTESDVSKTVAAQSIADVSIAPKAAPQPVSLSAPKVTAAGKQSSLLVKLARALRALVVRVNKLGTIFRWTVLLPTTIALVYFGLIASDIYISESRFVIRSPQHQQNTAGIGALLQGAGMSKAQDETYTVHDYILSRDALKELEAKFSVSRLFSSPNVDRVSRFAGLDPDNSFEALYRYYQRRVTLDLDALSSISTLSVSAYTAKDAEQMNGRLLELSEGLVNQLNERARADMLRFATAEVAMAEKKSQNVTSLLSDYRDKYGVFDPAGQSALQLQSVSRIQEQLIAAKIQLAQVRSVSKDNPQIPALQNTIDTLQSEIKLETGKVVGGDRSLSTKATAYEALAIEKGFAEKRLAEAYATLEQARTDAQRNQMYLERITQPSKPDVAIEPRRIRNILATLLLGLIVWGILAMLVAGVREHQD